MAPLCFLLLLLGFSSAAEFYSSIDHMTELLHTEQDLLASLEDYVRAEEYKLEVVKRWARRLSNLSALAIRDPEVFLGHPVNAFQLLKRLNREWRDLESLVRSDVANAFVARLSAKREHLPGEDDQTGAAEALLRLQDTYQLDIDTLAKGQLPGTSALPSALTPDDCFDLGLAAYKDDDFYLTEMWMSQAIGQMERAEQAGQAGQPLGVSPVTILDYHSYSLYKLGDLERALESTKKILELDPQNQRAKDGLKYYEHELANPKSDKAVPVTQRVRPTSYNASTYKRLCRGDNVELTALKQSRLFCRYYDNQRHPNLLLAPAKEEELWDFPRVVRYYDIASDDDMERIKEMARPTLSRSQVRNNANNSNQASRVRISQNTWLGNYQSPLLTKLINRAGYITGLDMTTAESMQVANYGVGGLYEPHIDFQGKEVANPYPDLGTGNRIATWMLYLSNVEAGGATVFPKVGAVAWPIKGSAVFWYNLHPNGEGDYYTQHAACPVLVGSKWVANTWLHERGQEFRRRCDLLSPAELDALE
ncbi:prolyl 4-hydroxylase subunit alpha-1-like [Syngnathus acus]|uniref:prolyl 4-hydroxylase subunit alpha-1-like n=1 Tax=Syngnathus acus TaxID=161584 RepID=UPI0018863907|nr:prolyl 4-hydroxylase subunit alpha-1-like [Syngnathus acus]XP_037133240.1 prolyl 4-hydroxylase subunit alpha-1-like [Syngnathus acus]